MAFVPGVRHLTRAKDLADRRYADPLGVDDLARAAGLSRAHFSREFRRRFGESPHAYLLTRRLERAAALRHARVRPSCKQHKWRRHGGRDFLGWSHIDLEEETAVKIATAQIWVHD